jgi:tetratricopeptide (TPR) repeat protein
MRLNFAALHTLLLAIAFATSGSASPLDPDQAAPSQSDIPARLQRIGADLFSRAEHIPDDIRELKAILAIDPRSAEAHLLLGIAYRSSESADLVGEAKAELLQAIELNPRLTPARYYLARIYLDLGRPERARDELNLGLEQQPGQPQFLALLGEAERQLGNPQRSLDLTREALKADESSGQTRYYLALALSDSGQRDEAIRELERVIRSGPPAVEAYVSLGSLYLDANRLDDALHVLTRGSQLGTSRPDVRIQLAKTYRLKGLLAKADAQLTLAMPGATTATTTAAQQHTESEFYLERGLLRLKQGRLVAATDALQKAVDVDPAHGRAALALAEVCLRRGLYLRAAQHAATAEKLGFPLADDKRKSLQDKLARKDMGTRK